MFRVVTKISASRLRANRSSTTKLHRTVRHYGKQGKNDLCPPNPATTKNKTGTAVTLGTLALLAGGTIAYAKYDPDFRQWLNDRAPFTDGIIKFVFQEEKSFLETLIQSFEDLKKAMFDSGPDLNIKKRAPEIVEVPKNYKPPAPVIAPLAREENVDEDCYTEIRLETMQKGSDEPNVEIVGETKQSVAEAAVPTEYSAISDLEERVALHTTIAIEAYNKAVYALKNYNNDIKYVVESSTEHIRPGVWGDLKETSKRKDEALHIADENATTAVALIDELHAELERPNSPVPEIARDQAKRNMKRVQEDLAHARKELEHEMKESSVVEKYWDKVEESRREFGEELQSLFPQIDLEAKEMNISEGDLDLFVLHAMAKVQYYQKELYKMETIGEQKLKAALDAARRGGADVLSAEQLCHELEKERIKLEVEFSKKCLKMRSESEHDLRVRLKQQSEAFSDHLNDALKAREEEMERMLNRNFDEKLMEERCKYKTRVAAMVGRLRGMDHAFKARADADRISHQAQVLWSACQALFKAVKAGCPGVPWKYQLRPLEPEITAVTTAAASNDELVKAVVAGIPPEAVQRGVYPEDALRERFLKVERVARAMALVPEKGAKLHMFLLSYLQAFFLLRAASPIPQSELNDDVTDFSDMSPNEIIQRARYWLDRGDFAQTLRYMNLLQGGSRAVARQWMEETRILLETQQAANTLMSHAAASGLVYL